MVVEAESLERRAAGSAQPMALISRAQIEAIDAVDLADVVALSPGAFVKQYGGLGGLRTLSLRGASAQQTVVLIDGVRYQSSAAGAVDLGLLPADAIEHEKSVLVAKAKEDPKMAGKPDQVLAKITEGQITKWLKEICLLDQSFVKNPDKTIEQLQQELVAKIGENIKIRRFARFELGEGLEKKKDDFAAEVAKQAGLA